MKLEYKKNGDYLIPLLDINDKKQKQVGIFGLKKLEFIKAHNHDFYIDLLFNNELNEYLIEVDTKCNKDMNYFIQYLKTKENVTEELKIENQLEWVRKMNNIKNRAKELAMNINIYE